MSGSSCAVAPSRWVPVVLAALLGGAFLGVVRGEEESVVHELPPLRLDKQQKALLASVSAKPETALDYYMLLPARLFSSFPADPPRRISYLDRTQLTRDFLQASQFIEGDGGGFQVILRVFRRPEGDLIAVSAYGDPVVMLLRRDLNQPGLNSVILRKPVFWEYPGSWKPVDEAILPTLSLAEVLDQYKNKYKADRESPGQAKFIDLDYVLLPTGNTIPLVGRENFMNSAPTWAEYVLTGKTFTRK